jgi:hypothetical protein
MSALSSKALFRATKPKRVADVRQAPLMAVERSVRPEAEVRRADDFYRTGQPEAIRALLARDGARLAQLGHVFEPACGDGALVREIERAGLPCIASDLVDRGLPGAVLRSYYDWSDSPAPAIITNPPFCEINARDGHGRWLKHSLDMPGWRYMALLLSWDWPAARANGLGALLDQRPFSYCYLMRWKLDFTGAGSPPQRNAWFVWDRDDQRAEPGFRWLDREDGRQADLFGGAGT